MDTKQIGIWFQHEFIHLKWKTESAIAKIASGASDYLLLGQWHDTKLSSLKNHPHEKAS